MAYFGPGSGGPPPAYVPPTQIAYGDTPVPGFSNSPYPGESYEAFQRRLQLQFDAMGQRALPGEWDALAPGGGGASGMNPQFSPLQIPGALPEQGVRTPDGMIVKGRVLGDGQLQGTVTTPDGRTVSGVFPVLGGRSVDLQGGGAAGGMDPLEQQRQLAFGALGRQQGFYQQDIPARQLQSQLMQRSSGGSAPYTDEIVRQLMGETDDAAASQFGGERDLIRQAMAGSGMSGSGIEASAIANARRAASKSSREGARRIRSQAALENFQARERAQQQSQQLLAQRQANMADATRQEVGLRSRFEVTGQGPFASTVPGSGQAGGGNAADLRTLGGRSGRATGGMGQTVGLQADRYMNALGFGRQAAGPAGESNPIMDYWRMATERQEKERGIHNDQYYQKVSTPGGKGYI